MTNAHGRSPEFERIALYVDLHASGVKLIRLLGEGTDGEVWATNEDTALKAFRYEFGYANERDTYLRLAEYGVTNQIAGFWIPRILGYDDELKVIELDLMQKPLVYHRFREGSSQLRTRFLRGNAGRNEAHGQWLFGKNWAAVKILMNELESYRIFYLDPKPHNIVFPTAEDDDDPLPKS